TLAFLGELDDERLASATEAAHEAARQSASFHLRLGDLGTFGPPRNPRVVWTGIAGRTNHLLALQEHLASALEARGFPREARPFPPHLTLARLKTPLPPAALATMQRLMASPSGHGTSWTVHSLDVMMSELLRPAARYSVIERVALGVSAAPESE